ncbi:MAG: hypothetical protein JNL90_05815 [Planctomycetes bacterium]|nr:hypothetical protein [Planctomycetota bacterium]
MKSRLLALLATTAAGAAAGGCSSAAWRDRAHDFAQVFEASGSVGPGMAAHVRLTELAQIGAGSFDGKSGGLLEGRFAAAREQRSELGLSLLHTYEFRRESRDLLDVRQPYFADPGWSEHPLSWQLESDRHFCDLGFGLHLAYVGVSATLKLAELGDALAGCFGFDPLGDDAFGRSLDQLREQALSLDAGERRAAYDALLRRGESIHGYSIYAVPDVTPPAQKRAEEAIRRDRASEPPSAPTSDAPPAGG